MARHAKKNRSAASATAKVALTGALLGAGAAAFAPSATAAPISDWERLAQCESGGDWHINTGNGFYGGLQFTAQTWQGYGGGEFAPMAHQATKDQQIWIAEKVLAGQGWGAWPACSAKLGLSSAPNTSRPKPVGGQFSPANVAESTSTKSGTARAATPANIADIPGKAVDALIDANKNINADVIFGALPF